MAIWLELTISVFILAHKGNEMRVFPTVISFGFCIGQYRDGDDREDAPHFITVEKYINLTLRVSKIKVKVTWK